MILESEPFAGFKLSVDGVKYVSNEFSSVEGLVGCAVAKSSPIDIHLITDTDLATFFLSGAGVVVAVTVGLLTVRFQRNQIRSNISNFRHQWITDLRNCSAKYFQGGYSLILRLETQDGYSGSNQFLEDYEKILIHTANFEMLLSRDDEYTRSILELDQKVINALDNYKVGQDFKVAVDTINELKSLVRQELERAWSDIKADVGFKSRKTKPKKGLKRILQWARSYL